MNLPRFKRSLKVVFSASAVSLLWLAGACTHAQQPAAGTAAVGSEDALFRYIARPEPVYGWKKAATPATVAESGALGTLTALATDVRVQDIELTSQEWQGQPWKHRVRVFHPEKSQHADLALIIVEGGSGSRDTGLGRVLAHFTGATIVNLSGIPNQPLYGRNEDALIAYTFGQYLQTGDATWPLLFPMTKSVVKAMDAVTELSKGSGWTPISRFAVTGASKRGWTTWLSAAADKRVIGIIPMVYDNLDLQSQMKHQIESWGAYSPQIADYTRSGLIEKMTADAKGKELSAMVDPWNYRDRITVPALIVNGTNDPYWPLDALGLYRSTLRGPTSVLYVPNAGHNLGGQEARTAVTIASWLRRIAANRPVPEVKMKVAEGEKSARTFTLTAGTGAETGAREARLWVARSATRDFRKAQWEALPMRREGDEKEARWTAQVEAPPAETPWTAALGEVDIHGDLPEYLPPMRLSSDVTLWK